MATLIESLTAMAVFAIGASASASWVAQSSARSAQAGARLKALAVVTDMEARLRANPEGVRAGDYQYAIPARIQCRSEGCSSRAAAGDDLARFDVAAARAFGPEARGGLRCSEGWCMVRLRWPGGWLDWGVAR
ncbi:prepilin-type N-terminal cleavage/methylation domain-containing protein [Luteibacter aegosomaticola]|uniref:prepilin-type N-terminal cleavage/methylation domain-containing protein n=1 Tax=Luteibacter aegosomaticola TaxID=2911538 RepID=UPI001FF7623D|nr:prepilin-type N-terminal cleavage/methylation domain-containing protein [Luteibacter aegosomaticola]UPG91954.1 prepilin-type N-terminal cleavage/methylation domain-containing protein [Luteibacter aegosomaticola]